MLRDKNLHHKFRVLTSKTRTEDMGELGSTPGLGNEIIPYLRAKAGLENTPILVYTALVNIPNTTSFVKNFKFVGSTSRRERVREYIDGLAGLDDITDWAVLDPDISQKKRVKWSGMIRPPKRPLLTEAARVVAEFESGCSTHELKKLFREFKKLLVHGLSTDDGNGLPCIPSYGKLIPPYSAHIE